MWRNFVNVTKSRNSRNALLVSLNSLFTFGESMSATRQVHWGRIVVAGFLSEVAVIAIFFLLLIAATLAGVPAIANPMSPLDYVDALLSSFGMVFLFTLWVGKGIKSGF